MLFNVAQLLKAPVGTIRCYEVREDYGPCDDVPFAGPIQGWVELTRVNYGVLVRATLESSVTLECSRCLERFTQMLTFPFEERFIPTIDVETGLAVFDPIEDEDEEDVFEIDDHHQIDLHEAIRQHALLRLPLQPLHSPDCLGLCPNCGRNRNLGECHCAWDQEVDQRWIDLRRLLEQSN